MGKGQMMELNNVTSLKGCNWNKSFRGKGIAKQVLREEMSRLKKDLRVRLMGR